MTKLDYVSDGDIIRAYTGGDIKIPPLFDDQRVSGITFDSLDSLIPQDWHEWIVDRLLTGRHSELRPWYHTRCGEEQYRFMLFQQLINGNQIKRSHIPLFETFIPKLRAGYLLTLHSFVNEDIPIDQIETWGQSYSAARYDLIFMGTCVFEELGNFVVGQIKTEKQKIKKMRKIEEILTA